jgi:hypothetical protein
VEPDVAAQIVFTLRFSLRPHMDRLEIWDGQDSGYGVECYPCSFSMEGSVVTKNFVGKVLPIVNRYGFVDSYSAVIRTMSRVKVVFQTNHSHPNDGMPFVDDSLSDTLGAHAFRISFEATSDRYVLPSRKAVRSVEELTTSTEHITAVSETAATRRSANLTKMSSRAVISNAASTSTATVASRATETACTESAESLGVVLGDDWLWHNHIPAEFGTSTILFSRQNVEASKDCPGGLEDELQGEWDGETFADGLPSGVSEFVGNGECDPRSSILDADADNLVVSHDACLELCGAMPRQSCKFFSYDDKSHKCLLFSACDQALLTTSLFCKTWRVPYDRFSKLVCKLRMVLRRDQIMLQIYNCGGVGGGIRRAFHEGFNYGSVVFASACHKPCVKVDDFPCTYADERTQFVFYKYYPFSVTWTTRSPAVPPGIRHALYSMSIAGNEWLYADRKLDFPKWTLQIYMPEDGSSLSARISTSLIPMVNQPSGAQVLNLKRSEFHLHILPRLISKEATALPIIVEAYSGCNASIASLLEYGTKTHQSASCASLIGLVFPAQKVTQPSGLTAKKFKNAAASECYQDFLKEIRAVADVCADLWQKCDVCVELKDAHCAAVSGSKIQIAVIDSFIVRELLKKILYLADAIYYLITAAYSNRRGDLCGATMQELVNRYPLLQECQLQDSLDVSESVCYNNAYQNTMNPSFFVINSDNCSKACHQALDILTASYGCCAGSDREAVSEWWQRVGHPDFKHLIIEWTSSDSGPRGSNNDPPSELFIRPDSVAIKQNCESDASAFLDCALPKCKHSAQGDDPLWDGWQDFPQSCCNITCPPSSRKLFSSSCNCICNPGFSGERCDKIARHVLAELKLTGISGRSFERKSQQDLFIELMHTALNSKSSDIEIDFFNDAHEPSLPLPPGAVVRPVRRFQYLAVPGIEQGAGYRSGVVGHSGGGDGRRDGGAFRGRQRLRQEDAAVIVRFRVYFDNDRQGMRLAELIASPSLEATFLKSGLASKASCTFLPMPFDSKGKLLCGGIYACQTMSVSIVQNEVTSKVSSWPWYATGLISGVILGALVLSMGSVLYLRNKKKIFLTCQMASFLHLSIRPKRTVAR